MKCHRLTVLLLFVIHTSFAQTNSGDIELYLNEVITDLPGSGGNDFDPPTNSVLTIWGGVISDIINDDLTAARNGAEFVGYQVTQFIDNSADSNVLYYILEEIPPFSKYWGTFVFHSNPCRKQLVLQSPHPRYDTNTGFESTYCFKRLSAFALFLSGTHRCNAFGASSCSGTTSVCGSSQAYRISDMAHFIESAFHKATEVIAQEVDNSVFIQLHGFAKNATDPYVIMSNGTRETPAVDYAAKIQDGLFDADNSLTFRLAHIDQSWTRLIGFTNTQGRMINESPNPCNESATATSGRFIHIEQERTKLRENETGWNKMFLALSSAFGCEIVTSVEEEQNREPIKIYPNPTTGILNIEAENIEQIKLLNVQGQELLIKKPDQGKLELIDMTSISNGIVLVQVQTASGISSQIIVKVKNP